MHLIFFITEIQTSDRQDNGPVTTKPHRAAALDRTSDMHLFCLSLVYRY